MKRNTNHYHSGVLSLPIGDKLNEPPLSVRFWNGASLSLPPFHLGLSTKQHPFTFRDVWRLFRLLEYEFWDCII